VFHFSEDPEVPAVVEKLERITLGSGLAQRRITIPK
jgi:hypothetical protein